MTTFDIDRAAPAQGRAAMRIEAPILDVWTLLSDLPNWTRWNPAIGRMYVLGQPGPGVGFEWTAGGLAIRSEIREFDPPHVIGWTGDAILVTARHVYRLTEAGPRTTDVETEESFSGVFARILPGLARRTITRALEQGLVALKAAAETPRQNVPKRAG